jgi:hypothetical protein
MSWTVDATDWTRQLSSPLHDGNNPKSLRASIAAAISMSLSLTTAGRLGFFIDYSELETVGTHNFYVTRTHGSQGAVGCTWTAYDSADGAQLATGSLSWANHSLDVLSFQVPVTSKPAGDHRVYVLLSNPTGGAALHHGDHTVAYGIIDDDTIATSNAIFIDADAETNGTGTQASPYNNWYSARDAVQLSTRFIYIKGMLVPDSTDTIAMSVYVKHLAMKGTFEGRTSESQRLVVRNWPNFVGGVDGGGQEDVAGFVCDADSSTTGAVKYVTLKGLTFTNLDNSAGTSITGVVYALRLRGNRGNGQPVEHWTVERANVDGLLSGANATSAVWYSEQADNLKMWGCTITNTTYALKPDPNLHAFQSYGTGYCSAQRNTLSSTAGGFYEKEGYKSGVGVGMCIRFNVINSGQILISTQGDSPLMDFHIFSNNIFSSTNNTDHSTPIGLTQSSTSFTATKTQIYNNVFYDYDYSNVGHLRVNVAGYAGVILFNNIYNEVGEAWRIDGVADAPEYIDYNLYHNNDLPSQPVVANNQNSYITISELQSGSTLEQNAKTGNPLFLDSPIGNFTLSENSPAINGGVSGTTMGAFAQDFIKIGAN